MTVLDKRLKGRIAIVTGASRERGIGTAVCRALAAEGADILFTHWTPYDGAEGCGAEPDWPDKLLEELSGRGVRVHRMEADLADEAAPASIVETAVKKLGPPSILINNACYCLNGGYRDMTADLLDRHYAVNVRGTTMLSLEFARRFESALNGKMPGRIVFLVSGGPDPRNLAYTTTKGALIALTEPLAAAVAPLGITVNAVDPGPTDTGWMNDNVNAYLLPKFPMGRIGMPEDAAKLIAFLAGDDSQWITGQHLKSEGGYLGR